MLPASVADAGSVGHNSNSDCIAHRTQQPRRFVIFVVQASGLHGSRDGRITN